MVVRKKVTCMKIAILSRYQNNIHRGAETFVVELSKQLLKKHQVDILSGSSADSLAQVLRGKYDVVIPMNGGWQSLKASFGRIWGNYKLVITGQSGIGRDDIWNIFVCKPDVFVALTDFMANWAKGWAWGTKIVKIPNGVSIDKFSLSGSKMVTSLPRPIVLSVGALTWYKHHERTIEAVSKVPNVSLLIVGQGPDMNKLQRLGDSKLEGRFKIISVKYHQMPKVYQAGDLFVLPSWEREAFGIAYLEAMASGLAVVAPDDLPRREIVGQAGILVDVADPDKYAEAIKEALSIDWQDFPRKQAERFSWEKIGEKYIKLFEGLK